jgi:hypothetical protein
LTRRRRLAQIHRIVRRLALAAIAALAAACGDDGGDSYETLVPATAEEFLALLPVVRCQQLVRCGAYTSMDRCVATIGTSTGSAWPRASRVTFDRWWQAGIARGTVAYSPGDAALCLASFGRGTCSAAVEALVDTTVCDGVLRGTLQTGETSTYPHECASLSWGPGPHCSYTTECCRETCSDERSFPPPFAPAEPCSSDAACGARRSCHEGFCMRGVAEGAACETSADCWSALICRGGRCVTAEPPPNECEQEGSAPSYACDRYGTSCDRSVMSCRPLGDLGDDCRGGELPCKRDLVCGDTSRCQLPPGLGERCSTRCGPDLVCSWTTEPWTCVAAGALADGEPCVLDDECSSGFCDRYADGQPRCAMPLACP